MKHILALAFLAVLVPGSALGQSAHISCNAPEGIPKANMLFFGELHGTKEAPELVGRVVCARALKGPVALGLEIPTSEQAVINRYLASDGGAASKAKLLSGDFWRTDNDGRASTAMLALIEHARNLKQLGLPITVFAFTQINAGMTYDASIAQTIRDFHSKHPQLRVVALMGNVHASQSPLRIFEPEIIPAGYLLRDLHPISVFLAYRSGSIWACMPDCGIHRVDSEWGDARQPGFYNTSPMQGYSVAYVLPSITASPPAIGASH